MTAHARLNPSSAERWIRCPGSVQAIEAANLPDKIHPAAYLGSCVHALCERLLTQQCDDPRGFIGKYVNLDGVVRPVKKAGFRQITPTILQDALAYVVYIRTTAYGADIQEVEGRVDYSHLVPEGFGTVDFFCLVDDTLHVIDLKYGMTPVFADNNAQLQLYALGVINTYNVSPKSIHMHIFQPRLNSISVEIKDREQLDTFGELAARQGALALSDNPPLVATEKGCQWCPIRTICTTQREMYLNLL